MVGSLFVFACLGKESGKHAVLYYKVMLLLYIY